MHFVKHGGMGKVFDVPHQHTPTIWSKEKFKDKLLAHGVWVAGIPNNVDSWYPKVVTDVTAGRYTFEEFVEAIAKVEPFDFGLTLASLRNEPAFA